MLSIVDSCLLLLRLRAVAAEPFDAYAWHYMLVLS